MAILFFKKRGFVMRTKLLVLVLLLLAGCHSQPAKTPLSGAEMAFLQKLTEFLSYCDGTARLTDEYYYNIRERVEKTTDLYAAIPEPPGPQWTVDALAAAKKLRQFIGAEAELARMEKQLEGMTGSTEKDADSRHAKTVTEIRDRLKRIRSLIPPAD